MERQPQWRGNTRQGLTLDSKNAYASDTSVRKQDAYCRRVVGVANPCGIAPVILGYSHARDPIVARCGGIGATQANGVPFPDMAPKSIVRKLGLPMLVSVGGNLHGRQSRRRSAEALHLRNASDRTIRAILETAKTSRWSADVRNLSSDMPYATRGQKVIAP